MRAPAYDPETIADEFKYIATKLDISVEELKFYMAAPNKTYRDYKSQESMFVLGAKVLKAVGVERAIKR